MHEPSDVTVELDGTGRQLSELSPGDGPEKGSGPTQDADNEITDGPVFVDASGRRSKKFRRAGWVVAIACAVFAVTLVVSLMGGSSTTTWLNIPGVSKPKEGGGDGVKEKPGPTDSPKAKHSKGGLLPLPLVTNSNGVVVTPSLSVNPTTGVTSTNTPTKGSTKPPKPSKTTTPGGVVITKQPTTPGGTTADPVTPPATDPVTPPATEPVTPPVTPPTTDPVDPPTPPTATPAGNEGSQNLAVEGAQ